MSGSVNKVTLLGNLGRDPEVTSTQDGMKIVRLSVATSDRWKDKNTGEQRDKTEWHRVVIFNENLVRVAKDFLQKGKKVYIEGQLQTRKWQDQSGNDRYSTEVVLGKFRGELQILDSRNSSLDSQQNLSDESNSSQSIPDSIGDDFDDDIPF